MRKEVFSIGSYVHIVHRGTRGSALVRDEHDRRRFLKLLTYLNDEKVPRNWEREITREHVDAGYARPKHWPDRKPYVAVMAYCLLDNHFHLLLREEKERGIARFMQRLCTSMAAHFNTRHKENGSLFQGPYRARVIEDDAYLQYASAYVQVKNAFDRQRPSGKRLESENFKELFARALADPFVSLGEYMGTRTPAIVDLNRCTEVLLTPQDFRSYAADVIAGRVKIDGGLEP